MSTEKPKASVTSTDADEKELDEDELERVSGGAGIAATNLGDIKGAPTRQKVLLDSSLTAGTMDPSKMNIKLNKI
jgi:bacteriocin-like protein